ncbi:phosphotransferase family protein [Actinopolymorpha pittospori]|uniref:Aminoglycoside phosphotransferase (APT) family kinase protein n=1 Tax=Actinopolymorpha pittospori TaxID=648752 RepID=A0A927RLS1_9ACTN|nr:aminoglycoside phosphotransferase family protein [Actinopolymorpha pittospori]MBE1608148.1 aminoglycoside phosphotransferase (APT) family kinase protein [Actinopolymorpha pittospori]
MTRSAIDLSPFADDVYAIAAYYGVSEKNVAPAPTQGQVNLTVYLGTELVLRIPRSAKAAEQLSKEAEVIPLVQDAGVPTSELVSYDATLRVGSVPYVVLERLHGATLAEQAPDPTNRRRALESLGEILVTLHRVRLSRVGSIGAIPAPFTFSPSKLLQRLTETGEIGSAQYDWLLEKFDLLQPEGPSQADPVLLHRDVIPSNLIVDQEGRVTALLDWGCAEWGSPARDLVGLPLQALPDLLSGYRSALDVATSGHNDDSDLSLERDALWYHLYLALARLLNDPSTSEDRNWAAPRNATLLDILAFVSSAGMEPWPVLLRRVSLSPNPPMICG